MRTVAIESPFAGDVERNLAYLDACILDCLARGETPYASHKMLTTALDDDDSKQRLLGIDAGLAMAATLDERVFYVDLGMSFGMEIALAWYDRAGLSYQERLLGGEWARVRKEGGA